MEIKKIRLGKTGLLVTKTAFGALPIQRISKADAVKLVRRAYDAGINYFDTANMYTDSEEKLGEALHDVRQNVVISTKSGGADKKTVQAHIEQSLRSLRTDYIDLFQFHNPAACRTSTTRTAPLPPRWRPSRKATSATSVSPTTG
mgnify:CR=1 FL=1